MRVLIAAPISGNKQYSINQWFDWISNQTHKDYDFALCVNGKEQEELISLLKQVEIIDVHNQIKKPIILQNKNLKGVETTFIHNIVHARESLRLYAVKNCYDKIFWLDTDTIPHNLNTIDLLIESKKLVISGLYFYKKTTRPVAVNKLTGTNFTIQELEQAINNKSLLKAGLFGLGCVLVDKSIFKKIKFEYSMFGKEITDDYGFCYALHKRNIDRWVNPLILCHHLGEAQKNIAFQIKTD